MKQCLIIKKWRRFSQKRWLSSDLNEIEKTSVLKFEYLKKCLKFDNITKIVQVSISSLFNIEIEYHCTPTNKTATANATSSSFILQKWHNIITFF